MVTNPTLPIPDSSDAALEYYKYLLQEIEATNQNVHKYVALYQTLGTALGTAALVLLVSYQKWNIPADIVRGAVTGLLTIITFVAAFACLLVIAGMISWFDFRKEECRLLEDHFGTNFRQPPQFRNFWRWTETYILLFIVTSIGLVWLLGAFAVRVAVP